MAADLKRIKDLVSFLCSRECAGREPGTPGSDVARARIVSELEAALVQPAGQDGFLHRAPNCGWNVVGRVPGSGPLAERAIVVGAHYDHLGHDEFGRFFHGADDNAAAVAILLEVARGLGPGPIAGRQVILIAFDGEEPPHFSMGSMGSMAWVKQPTVPLDRIDQFVCMDLVGHALGPAGFPDAVRQSLFVLGAERSPGTAAVVEACTSRARGVVPRRMNMSVVPPLSDYLSFERSGVASLFLTCGRWEHYHQITDTPEKLDYPKIAATAAFLEDLVRTLAARKDAPVPYAPDRRDDLVTIRTLLDVGRLITPMVPQVKPALAALTLLEAAAGRGALAAQDRVALQVLVGQLESVLG